MTIQHDDESRGVLRWWFEDRSSGHLVVGQTPNLLLWIFIIAWTTNKVVHPAGLPGKALSGAASASLVLWSLDEIARGVNPWRRALGTGVFLAETVSWLRG